MNRPRPFENDDLVSEGQDLSGKGHSERPGATSGRREAAMSVVVTGSSGFLGSALVPFVAKRGHAVTRLIRSGPHESEIHWDPVAGRVDGAALEGMEVSSTWRATTSPRGGGRRRRRHGSARAASGGRASSPRPSRLNLPRFGGQSLKSPRMPFSAPRRAVTTETAV